MKINVNGTLTGWSNALYLEEPEARSQRAWS